MDYGKLVPGEWQDISICPLVRWQAAVSREGVLAARPREDLEDLGWWADLGCGI